MALSDVCFEFMAAVRAEPSNDARRLIAHQFADSIAHYSDGPFDYGDEIETLAYAITYVTRSGTSRDDALDNLMLVAEAVLGGLDTPPGPNPGEPRGEGK